MEVRKLVRLFPLMMFFTLVNSKTRENHIKLQNYLLANYSSDIIPIANLSEHFNIEVQLSLRYIKEFNVVDGVLSFNGGLYLKWRDEYLQWNPEDYGNINSTGIKTDKVWTPNFVLITSISTDYLEYDKGKTVTTVSYDGQAQYAIGGYFQSICQSDITFYPFDRHVCAIEYSPTNTWNTPVNFSLLDEGISDSVMKPSGTWKILSRNVKIHNINELPVFEVSLTIERMPHFLVLNIFAPVFLLTTMNLFVFFMPAESGERISYSTTLLLALVVFMTIVADKMPQTSNPIPYVSYKLLVDIIVSALITLCSIITLRIYHKDNNEEIPRMISVLTRLCVHKLKVNNNVLRYSDTGDINKNHNFSEQSDFPFDDETEKQEQEDKKFSNLQKVTWKQASMVFDRIFFIVFMFIILTGEIAHLTMSFCR